MPDREPQGPAPPAAGHVWRRRIAMATAVTIAMLGIVAVVALSRLDGVIRDAIVERGSALTQTAVAVDSVHLSLATGTATLHGLTVANPEGFSAPYAFELGEIRVQLALRTLLADPLVIEDVRIDAPRVTCELDGSGKSNIEQLRHAVEHAGKRDRGAGEPGGPREVRRSDRSAPRRLIVQSLTLRDGAVHVDARAVGGPERTETLPGFDLTDIGVAEGGVPAAEVGRIVLTALARDVAVAVAATQLERFIGKQLGGPAGELLKKGGAEAIRKGLGGVLDQLLRPKKATPIPP